MVWLSRHCDHSIYLLTNFSRVLIDAFSLFPFLFLICLLCKQSKKEYEQQIADEEARQLRSFQVICWLTLCASWGATCALPWVHAEDSEFDDRHCHGVVILYIKNSWWLNFLFISLQKISLLNNVFFMGN